MKRSVAIAVGATITIISWLVIVGISSGLTGAGHGVASQIVIGAPYGVFFYVWPFVVFGSFCRNRSIVKVALLMISGHFLSQFIHVDQWIRVPIDYDRLKPWNNSSFAGILIFHFGTMIVCFCAGMLRLVLNQKSGRSGTSKKLDMGRIVE